VSELEILFPKHEIVTLGRSSVRIYPVRLRHFELYGKSAGAMIELFNRADVAQVNKYASKHSKELRQMLRATTSLNRWQLYWLPATAAVQLLCEVVRVNSGFFGEALPAMARSLAGGTSPSAS
jgi:hypothetical protein